MFRTTLFVFFAFTWNISFAQPDPIDTDRPGNSNSAGTVVKKWLQAELGFLRQAEKISPPKRDLFIQHPALLTKYGLTKCLEIRLVTEFASVKEYAVNDTSIVTGISNIQLGGKFNFLQQKGIIPKTSLIAHYSFNNLRTLPGAKDSIDGANFRLAMSHSITKKFSLGYNIGMDWSRFGSAPAYLYTFIPSFNIIDKLQVFIELYGFAWKSRMPQNSIDGGLSYLVTDNFKIDVSAGFGLSKNAPDNFYAAGVSYRFKIAK